MYSNLYQYIIKLYYVYIKKDEQYFSLIFISYGKCF